jgi:RibD C-terminal domain
MAQEGVRLRGCSVPFARVQSSKEMMTVGAIGVHEFITLDGVIGAPSWTMEYSFDPPMGEAIGAIMGSSKAILLGRRTFEEFAPAWSTKTAADDPGRRS